MNWKVSEAQKRVIAILADGTVVIAQGDPLNPHLVSVKSLAKRWYSHKASFLSIWKLFVKYMRMLSRDQAVVKVSRTLQKMQRDFIELVRAAGEERASDIHILLERFPKQL